ncbi:MULTISPECIES: class I adenylate-forming enzyme family protein [unclassified Microbispora]|uniref:class I adenylate-forming enzyme family protein n=1 Tax=unclassified Microbispora TaxID=2614687 RepID=UPI001601F208|nr:MULTISPECIES: class I adenylate-forming enzyme family protein [unclassified Microbispora]
MTRTTRTRRTPTLTVPELLRLRAQQEPDGVAMIVEGQGTLTFAEWERRSAALAAGLAERGVAPGDRVAVHFGSRDWIDFAVAFCGVLEAGAVAVPMSDRLAPAEIRYMIGHCSASAVLLGRDLTLPPDRSGSAPGPAAPEPWTATPAELESVAGPGSRPDASPVRPGDLAQILYTSGTTGRPKGVGASHANLAYGCVTQPRHRRFAHSRHLLHAFPIGTNAGQTMLINALDARPTVLTPARFTPGRFARLIETYRPGTVFLVPSMAVELLDAGLHERHDMSGVVLLGSAAAALPPALAERLAAAFPNATVTNYYTSTEAAPAQTIMIYDRARPAALGRPAFDGSLRIADEEGNPLPPGETGEVWMRSPAASRSYYGDEEASARAFRDGWVRMGDVGYVDADGYLYLVDRESDVVKTGAYKVSTLQVEAALYEHPGIAEAAVFGLPHPVLGSVLGAAVVARSGPAAVAATVSGPVSAPVPGAGQGLSASEVRAFLMDRLAWHELPERILVVDDLPRNQSGKVIKKELLTLLGDSTISKEGE